MLGEFAKMAAAATWLVPGSELPWRWEEDCETLVWEDGTTIVFREELAQILERLGGGILPPSGSTMLLLGACRGKLPPGSGLNGSIITKVLGPLRGIASFPPTLKSGVAARAALVTHVLGSRSSDSAASLPEVIKLLRSELPFTDMLEVEIEPRRGALERSLTILQQGLQNLDTDTLHRLLDTGLPVLPEPPEALAPELPETLDLGKLFLELLADPELAGIARAARQIMAAVTLPQALSRAEDESLGGVSDIGNRGPLHRLLLSELAHDDETLAARLALNEALYLRREPAASHPPSQLVVLIDVGVRMWGLPRVLGTAAALTFLAKGGKRVHPVAYRSAGGTAVPAVLWTKEGLTEHLGALDTAIDATAALGTLLKQLGNGKGHVDLVVITHCRTLEERAFVDLLPSSGAITVYAVGVNREGHVAICTRTPHTLRQMNEAWIDPATLFGADSRDASALRDPSGQSPAIFRAQPFPFLLPTDGPVEIGWAMEGGGGVCLTTAGTLWHWPRGDSGAVRIAAPRMKGRTLGLLHARQENCWIAVKHHAAAQRLEIARWFPERGTGADAVGFTAVEGLKGVPCDTFARGGFLYAVFSDHVIVISLATGHEVGRGEFPAFAHPVGTRFLDLSLSTRETELGFFYWGGLALSLVALRGGPYRSGSSIVLIFDRAGYDFPWAVDQHGRIFDLAHPESASPSTMRHLIEAKASPTGSRVWLRFAEGPAELVLLGEGTSYPCGGLPQHLFDGYVEPRRWSLRSKFTHIGLSPAGGIMLRAQKGYYVELTFMPGKKFVMTEHDDSAGVLRQVPFADVKRLPEASRSLRYAEWPDGSRAFLDSRGLLHLQSRDTSIPEVSFILAVSTALPAWSSDGRQIGPAYFLRNPQTAPGDADAIASHVQCFASAIL